MPHSIFFYHGYAIHGTNYISRLGRRASHGCVRLHPRNAAILFELVQRYGKRNTRIVVSTSSHYAGR
jgi:lipoprotein-anchoring transpeptidase ErfK/SrfK